MLITILKTNVEMLCSRIGDKKIFIFNTLVIPLIIYDQEVWACNICRENWNKIEQIQKHFITDNLKLNATLLFPFLLIEVEV